MNFFSKIIKSFLKKNNYFTTSLYRPKNSIQNYKQTFTKSNRKLGILIQGPVDKNCKFLIESIKIYKKIFPKSKILLSTWENIDIQNLNNLKKLRIKIILNKFTKDLEYPLSDYQIKSTYQGLVALKKMRINDVIKIRTDARIYKNNLYDYFLNLQKKFPVNSIEKKIISKRIIVSSLLTHKFRLFGLSDIFLFGQINDLLKYFNNKYYFRFLKENNLKKIPPLINSTLIDGETFFCFRFLKENKIDFNWSIKGWCSVLKKYFIVVDKEQVDLFWKKYNWKDENRNFDDKLKTSRFIDFNDWLNIYSNNFKVITKYRYREKWKYFEKKLVKISKNLN
tara:strand:- start:131 stop:1141 length:1011 start_codon:yes stop_codon:yes gene_type:complete